MKAIIFDLDGTIADTYPLLFRSFKEALEPLINREISESEILATFGPTDEGTVRAICPDKYDEGILNFWNKCKELHYLCPEPFKGIMDILNYLKTKNVILGMVTGRGETCCDISLSYYGIKPYFDVIKTGTPTKQVKTERLQEIISEYSLNKDEVLYIGDAVSDITCSRKAGIKIISVLWSSVIDEEGIIKNKPDEVFYTVNDLKQYLMNIL